MRNNILKKSLIIGIIFLLLSTMCIPFATANDGKPDLIIEDIILKSGHEPFSSFLYCSIKNIGDSPTPRNSVYEVYVRCYWLLFGFIPLVNIKSETKGGQYSGSIFGEDTYDLYIEPSDTNFIWGAYGFYLVVNPNRKIDESNYLNNMYNENWFYNFIIGWFPLNFKINN